MLVTVIPARNEQKTINLVASEAAERSRYVIVVDDGSTYSTDGEARRAGVDVIYTPGLGYATAVIAGVRKALDYGATMIVTMDAGGSHYAGEISTGASKLIVESYDLVVGTRVVSNASPLRRGLTLAAALVVSRALDRSIPDATSGFRWYNRKAAFQLVEDRALELLSNHSFNAITLIRAARAGLKIGWSPIYYRASGSSLTMRSALRSGMEIIRECRKKSS